MDSARPEAVRTEVRDIVRKSEQTLSNAGRKWMETFSDVVPGDRDSVGRVVDGAFDFVETVLKSNRELVHSTLDAVLCRGTAKKAPPVKKAATRAPNTRKPRTRVTAA